MGQDLLAALNWDHRHSRHKLRSTDYILYYTALLPKIILYKTWFPYDRSDLKDCSTTITVIVVIIWRPYTLPIAVIVATGIIEIEKKYISAIVLILKIIKVWYGNHFCDPCGKNYPRKQCPPKLLSYNFLTFGKIARSMISRHCQFYGNITAFTKYLAKT